MESDDVELAYDEMLDADKHGWFWVACPREGELHTWSWQLNAGGRDFAKRGTGGDRAALAISLIRRGLSSLSA